MMYFDQGLKPGVAIEPEKVFGIFVRVNLERIQMYC
jgi:hypothetical protein